MLIDNDTTEYQEFPNFKGGEKSLFAKMIFDGSVRILRAYLPPGASIGYHRHEENAEIMYFLSGSGIVNDNGEERPVAAGQTTYCEKGKAHSLTNNGSEDLHFFAVVPELR